MGQGDDLQRAPGVLCGGVPGPGAQGGGSAGDVAGPKDLGGQLLNSRN
jgi:hypothetical protein